MPAEHFLLNRRQWLGSVSLGLCLPASPVLAKAASHAQAAHLAAAWTAEDEHYIGRLQVPATGTQPLQVVSQQRVPSRAHGMCCLSDGSLVFASRRPGDWLVRLPPPGSTEPEQWHWIEPDRCFNGHVIASRDGRHLYTTETDLADSQGLIGVRDRRTLEKVAEWRTGGMDPHQLLLNGQGQLIVANGGIPSQTETGRRKLKLDRMDSSIVRMLPDTGGEIAGLWRLQDPRLSLRHLSWGPAVAANPDQQWLGIALQAEHDDPVQRQAAPVLAVWDGKDLRPVAFGAAGEAALPGARHLGYGGDISAHAQGFVVSCPRADLVTRWRMPRSAEQAWSLMDTTTLAGAYCVSNAGRHGPSPTTEPLWIGGQHSVLEQTSRGQKQHRLESLQLDNHWMLASALQSPGLSR
ncbi:DUF1513 domain-containing protein [Comamonas testosteroni]